MGWTPSLSVGLITIEPCSKRRAHTAVPNAGLILETSLGYFINPLVNVLLGVLVFRERLRPAQWSAVALAGAGVAHLTLLYGSLPWIALGLAFASAATAWRRRRRRSERCRD